MAQPDLNSLVRASVDGDESAWQDLWRAIEPRLVATLRRATFLGRLSQSEDDCRNIAVEVMGRLRANRFGRLGHYLDALRDNPTLPFMAWLAVVAKRSAIDYMRAHETYIDRRRDEQASKPGGWRDVTGLPDDSQLGARPPYTERGTAHEVMEFAGSDLPMEQRAALEAWLAGSTFEEIAGAGDADDAEKRVRAALRRVRRRFRENG
jgi:DNA-directed RNA polymerase specialized sigma24 family protein